MFSPSRPAATMPTTIDVDVNPRFYLIVRWVNVVLYIK